MAIEPIKGFYVHDEVTDTDGVAKVSIEAIQEFEDDIRDETSKWLDDHPEAITTIQDGSITPVKIANFSTDYRPNAGIVEQLNTLNSKFAPLVVTSTGAWTDEQALTDFANAVDALPAGIYLGRLAAGSICGFILMKATPLYGSCIFFSYTGAISNACGKRDLINGKWSALKSFNMTAVQN